MATEAGRFRRGAGVLLLLAAFLPGCSLEAGRLYTDWTQPLTTDYAATPRGNRSCVLAEHHLKEPFTGSGVSIDWTSEVIRRAMREAGMDRAYYADRRVFSVLGGVYRRTTIVIHGD
jgi:hypothetical protein